MRRFRPAWACVAGLAVAAGAAVGPTPLYRAAGTMVTQVKTGSEIVIQGPVRVKLGNVELDSDDRASFRIAERDIVFLSGTARAMSPTGAVQTLRKGDRLALRESVKRSKRRPPGR